MIGQQAPSFQQLVIQRTMLVLSLVFIACGACTVWVVHNEVTRIGREQAIQRIETAVPLAVFPLLVAQENGDEARKLANDLLGADVHAAEVLHADGTRVAASGNEAAIAELAMCGSPSGDVERTSLGWCVSKSVVAASVEADREQQIGSIRLLVSNAWSGQLLRGVMVTNAIVWAVVFVIAVIIAWRGARRVMRPLKDLAESMRLSVEERTSVRAPLRGAREIVIMGHAFNVLMERLEDEARTLESKVEERTIELQRAKDDAQSTERYTAALMAGISHEMRTPLHVIQGFSGLTRGELEFIEGGEAAKEYQSIVQKEATQLLERVDELLRYSGVEAGSRGVSKEPVELTAVGRAVEERCAVIANSQGNRVRVSATDDLVIGDRQLLTQIVSNLATNACKFTRGGTIDIRLGWAGGQVQLEVEDDGPGLNAEVAGVLRGDTDTRRFRGTGLGLTIVRRFIELVGGRLEIHTQAGKGTKVEVFVPAARAERPTFVPQGEIRDALRL